MYQIEQNFNAICPCCHKPVRENSVFCFSCKHFIDLNENRLLKENEVTDKDLDYFLEEEKQAYMIQDTMANQDKKSKTGWILIGIGAFLMFTLLFIPIGAVLIFVGVVFLLHTKIPANYLYLPEMENVFSEYLVAPLLKNQFGQDLEYRHEEYLPIQKIHDCNLLRRNFNHCEGNDYIKTVWNGLAVEWSDISLELHNTIGNNSSSGPSKLIFKGIIFSCNMEIQLPHTVAIWEQDDHSIIPTENIEDEDIFYEKFQVEAYEAKFAEDLLTQSIRKRLIYLDALSGGQTFFHFSKDGELYFAAFNYMDLFHFDNIDESSALLRERFLDECSRLKKILSALAELKDELKKIDI